MSDSRRSSIRLSPRRHDVGAALMLEFRPKDGSNLRNRRLRIVDILRACLLPVICFTLAFAVKEQRGAAWTKPTALAAQPVRSPSAFRPNPVRRVAPPSPFTDPHAVEVRLTHIEDGSDDAVITQPVSLSREIRVADEEPPVDSKSASKPAEPSLRAALHLGDQPLRAVQR